MKYTIFSFAIIFTFFVGASYASAQSYAPGCEWLNPAPSCGGYGGDVTNSCGSPSNCVALTNGCYSCQCATITVQGKQLTSVGPTGQCIPSYSGASCTTGYTNGFATFCGSGASSGTGTPSSGGERNYDINISPSIQSINQNDTAVYTVNLIPEAGAFGNSVRLQLNSGDCPQGATCSFVGGYVSGGIPMIGVTFGMDYSPVTATFTITTSGSTYAPNTYSFRINSDVLLATGPSATAQLSVSATQILGATCSSFSAPNTVQVGQTFVGSFTMLNSGTKNWSALGWNVNGSSYLISMPNWSTVWGPSGITLPSSPITPGSSATFSATFTAPSTAGTYPFTFQMGELGTGMYGSQCTKNITVINTPPPPSGNPPTLTVDFPTSGATVSGTVSLSGWAIDNTSASETAISSVRVYLDGVLLGTATPASRPSVCFLWNRPGCPNVGWTYSWNSTLTSNGSHTIRIDATDSDSTPQTSSVSRSVTVSNIVTPAPTVTLSATPSSVTSGGTATLSWTVANATSCTNVGTNSIPNANWTSGTSGSVSSGPVNASRSYRLSCTGAGGTTLSNIATISIATTNPTVTVTVSPNPVASNVNPSITITSTNASYCMVFNDDPYGTNLNPSYSTSGTFNPGIQSVGSHTAYARCFDSSWTISSGNVSFPYTVENGIPSQPDLTASSPTPTTATVGTPITFSSTISNNGGASTGASFSNFFQIATGSNGTGTVTDLTSSIMSSLGASGTGTATSPSYTFSSAGTYYIRACADKTNSSNTGTIIESNEANNCSGSWTSVIVGGGSTNPTVTVTVSPNPVASNVNPSITITSTNASYCMVFNDDPYGTNLNPSYSTSGTFNPGIQSVGSHTAYARCFDSSWTISSGNVSFPYTVETILNNYNLNIIKSGQGTVNVSRPNTVPCPPTGCAMIIQEIPVFSCGSTCSSSIEESTNVILRATQSPNRIFVGWSGVTCYEGNQRSSVCSFRMNSDKTVYANFVVDPNYKEF